MFWVCGWVIIVLTPHNQNKWETVSKKKKKKKKKKRELRGSIISEENPVPDMIQLQSFVPIESEVIISYFVKSL